MNHAIKALDEYAITRDINFAIIIDEHQSRKKLLEGALKTMYGREPLRQLIQPPIQAESHLFQTIQAADWISAIIGPLWAYRAMPLEFSDCEWAETLFATRIASASTHSRVILRRDLQGKLRLKD